MFEYEKFVEEHAKLIENVLGSAALIVIVLIALRLMKVI